MYKRSANLFMASSVDEPPVNFMDVGCDLDMGAISIANHTFKMPINSNVNLGNVMLEIFLDDVSISNNSITDP